MSTELNKACKTLSAVLDTYSRLSTNGNWAAAVAILLHVLSFVNGSSRRISFQNQNEVISLSLLLRIFIKCEHTVT